MCVHTIQSSEILTLTYGGIVRQLVADNENVGQVNAQLKKMYVTSCTNLCLGWSSIIMYHDDTVGVET